ncbi:MAG: hypothetical protein ACUVQP_07990 [Bacteroidales bacterium]
MSKKTVYIVSLKFAPGLKKEVTALGENFKKRGFDVTYLLSQKYSNLNGIIDGCEYLPTKDTVRGMLLDFFAPSILGRIREIFYDSAPDIVIFYNPHPLNPFVAKWVREFRSDAVLCLYLHEPYNHVKNVYGFVRATYLRVVEVIQTLTIKYMHYIILPSENSLLLFKKRYPQFKGSIFIAPLLISDSFQDNKETRKYYSMIGNVNNATGHDTFIELANFIGKNKLDFKLFLLTSSNISQILKRLTHEGRRVVEILNRQIINDSEINDIVRQSIAVFRLDKEVAQSGVIPVCYMNKTPVIVRDLFGLTQHVWHSETGFIVPYNCKPENIVDAMIYVRENFATLSENARKKYEEIWADWNWGKYYVPLIQKL